ncbi:type I polyketide synthase [Rhodococcus sp. H29-C3]|uniref:type I polyketide synthase n=1 Tax=Rhodococcus sp. H29-C3 TaxID=3046307 RepID=UPI0024BAA7D3|nr:type I polyketide synthase [Rhodococcus sp. H29-C3]MDJ0363087.1 SDR family NAD(P)-dependent oxidoreductase [Rhodococcus sp. H29-C3]
MTGHVAVVGLSTRFPGAATVDQYWSLIREGRSGLSRLSTEELLARGVSPSMVRDRNYVPVAGIIDEQSHFDSAAWGFTEAEASTLDPQHRMLMECAWLALDDSGHGHGRGAGAVGVFVGSTQSGYLAHNLADRWDSTGGGHDPLGSMQTAIATQPDYLPLQIAYRLGLTGPAIAVSTSCSTSLVAIHLATQSLLSGECDTALAGGVSAIVPQGRGYLHVEGGVFSRDGEIAPFGARGSGIVYSQGAGAVVLRRLDDAIADGDPILAVLHGSAVNNDGTDKAGFTAPSVRGQARVVAEALAAADAVPSDIGLIEAHGTATRLGDPIELAALRTVFGRSGPPWCGLGSVKGNIGHTNSAAGIASFAKTVLAIHHRTLPVSLGSDVPAEGLRLAESPFELLRETRPWDTPPLAGVSSFGIGGTNAHVVLGPAPVVSARPTVFERPVLLISSGATTGGVRATADAIADFAPLTSPVDLAHTLAVGRAELEHRTAAVLDPAQPLARPSFSEPVAARTQAPSLIFTFPGAGGHYRGMGADLYRDEPVFRTVVDEVAELLVPHIGADVRDIFDRNDTSDRIRDVAFAVPALFAISLGTARLLQSWGLTPTAILGHSLGECTAAAFTGALTLPDACTLVAARCTAAARSAGIGAMMSVALPEDEIRSILTDLPALDLAAVNGPNSCVIAGTHDELRSAEDLLKGRGVDVSMLNLAAAMHSRHVESALGDVERAVHSFAQPSSPSRVGSVFSTVTGDVVEDATLRQSSHWVGQLRSPVQFSRALTAAVNSARGDVAVVEVGPGSSLTGLARAHGFGNAAATVSTMNRDESESITVRAAVGRLWSVGVPVDVAAVSGASGRPVRAPGYQFDRRHLWIEPADAESVTTTAFVDLLQLPLWRQLPPAGTVTAPSGVWVIVGKGPVAEALRRRFEQLEVTVLEPDGSPTEVSGVVTIADAAEHGDEAVEAVTTFAETAAHLVPLLIDGALWMSVTYNGTATAHSDTIDPVAAAVRALPRILGQECPGLRWAATDLGIDIAVDPQKCADVVVHEVTDALGRPATRPSSDVTVGVGTRWTSTLTSWPAVETPEAAVQPGTQALIVGGSGAVGRLLNRHLSELGYDVVVTSRRDRSHTDADSGADRHIVSDATDAADLADVMASIDAEGGPIGLVVHAAGVAASVAPITLTTGVSEAARAHLDSKLTVAQNIHRAISGLTEDRRPVVVLCMSSATGMLGGIGMGPYAAANMAMDAYAAATSSHRTRWVSIGWDGWRPDLGQSEVGSTIAMSGALDADTGLAAFDRILGLARTGRCPAVVAVSTSDLDARSRTASVPRKRTAADSDLSDLTDTQQGVAEIWSELFGTPVEEADADFFALGGHSLLGTRMLDSVRRRFGVELGLRDLLTAATLAEFSGRVDAAGEFTATRNAESAVPALSDVLGADATFEMTRVQHAYWIGRDGGYEWGNVPCHFYLEYDCVGLDLERYGRALDAVIARHPLLRSVATPDGRLRTLDSVPPYRIRTRDLTSADAETKARSLAAMRQRIAEKPGPPDRWPLVQIAAATVETNRVRLFIGVDVLICDAASWWIIESELKTLYDDPDLPLPALDLHPAQCSSAMVIRRHGRAGVEAERYWLTRADSIPGPPELPIRAGLDRRPRFVRRATALRPEQWSRFVTECRRHRITPTAALLTMYTDALRTWSTTEHFSVVLTLFDRPPVHPDVNKVVGDFTSLIVHESEAHAGSTFADRAQATQRRMFDDLDHREYSALELLAEQSTRSGERRSIPVVFTGALGVHDMVDDSGSLEWVGTQVHAVGQTPQTWLDHQVLEQDGELRLQWDALDGLFADDELDQLVARHTETIAHLADNDEAWTHSSGTTDLPAVDPADVLVPLRGARASGGADGPTLFLIHPSGGDVLCYAELSRRLATDVAVVALTDPQLTGDIPGQNSIEAIAAQYLSALRNRYPTPLRGWLLGGWSMGGTLAQEMARQLYDDGEHTALIIMLDSNDPTYITAIEGTTTQRDTEVARRQLGALEAFLDIDLDIGEAAWSEIADLDVCERNNVIAAKLRSRRLLGPRDDGSSRREVFGRHLSALARHEPRLLSDPNTETVLVRCTELAPNNSGIGMGIDDTPTEFAVDLGWSRHLTGPLTVVDADAHHYSILRAPALDAVLAHLDRALTKILDRH